MRNTPLKPWKLMKQREITIPVCLYENIKCSLQLLVVVCHRKEWSNCVFYATNNIIEEVNSGMGKDTRIHRENHWPLARQLTHTKICPSGIQTQEVRGVVDQSAHLWSLGHHCLTQRHKMN